MRAIVFIGPPGSGKGTQGKILGQVPGFHFLSMGEILRSVDQHSEPGRTIRPYLESGELVPSDLVLTAFRQHLEALQFQSNPQRVILDGMPRNKDQVGAIAGLVDVERILHLVVEDEEILIQRLLRRDEGREDDADEEIIRHRFDVYANQTEPVLQQYPRDLVSRIDAAGKPLKVLSDVVDALLGDSVAAASVVPVTTFEP